MALLEKALPSSGQNLKLIVKPHPNCPINPTDYPKLNIELTVDSLSNLLNNCDAAYTSAVTSAAVEAYCAGIPVISALNPNILNMSPLRGIDGVEFVANADELVNAIEKLKVGSVKKNDIDEFFYLDPELSKWKKLLYS